MSKGDYHQLKYEERVVISHLRLQGHTVTSIAKQLNRHKSTISRELQRNGCRSKQYYPIVADRRMRERRFFRRLLMSDVDLQTEVIRRLQLTFSPQQVAESLANERNYRMISYETIYRYIYDESNRDLKLWHYLRFNKKPVRQMRGIRRTKSRISQRISIHERPKEINQRTVFGHWEADLLLFQRETKKNLLVLKERITRFTLVAVNHDKLAENIAAQCLKLLGVMPKGAINSITFDNDLAFASHIKLQEHLKIKTYFCDPYKSYQKGAVEQANLWLRERFPRTTFSEDITPDTVDAWLKLMNNRPLRCLNYQTPAYCFEQQLAVLDNT